MHFIPDRYELTGPSMSGGMGNVKIAFDTILERQVAIKFIANASNKRRMEDEVAALIKLRSKHVVQVYDVLQAHPDEIGIVQEFVDGKDLFESFEIPTDATALCRKLWQIASGITDMHDLDVIHRDIKPNNMKIDPEGVVKIFDFGLARDSGAKAKTITFVGTPGFAAPELYAAPFFFTKSVDIYAFGVVALFLFSGKIPDELLESPPLPKAVHYFSSTHLAIPIPVATLLNDCLSPEPANRPSMREVRDILARHLLYDRHRALFVYQGKESFLSDENRFINLTYGTIAQISIRYNGLQFSVESASGEVQINNAPIAVGSTLPGSCVISLGVAPRRSSERRFITVDISHPEIVL